MDFYIVALWRGLRGLSIGEFNSPVELFFRDVLNPRIRGRRAGFFVYSSDTKSSGVSTS